MPSRVSRLADFYAALSRTNSAIVRIPDPDALFAEICRICVDHGHAKVAYVAIVEGNRARPVAWAGPADVFLDGIDIPVDDPQAVGPIASVVRSGTRYVANDLRQDPRTEPWRERAERLGSRATAAFPIRRGGRVVGALSVHVSERHFFDDALVGLLDEVAADLSFALDNVDRERARCEALRDVEAGLERFRKIFRASPVATVISTIDEGRILAANDAYCDFMACEPAQVIGREVRQLDTWLDLDDRRRFVEQLRDQQHVRDLEMRMRTLAGVVRDVVISAELIEFDERECILTILSDVTERKHYEARVQYLATHDGMTDLPNRTLLLDRVGQAVVYARRGTNLAVLCYIDLEGFKSVNNAFGHAAGDRLMVSMAGRLRAAVGEHATVARIGGDEFAVLLPDIATMTDAWDMADKLRERIVQPVYLDGRRIDIDASIGVALCAIDGSDPEQLLHNAYAAMTQARASRTGVRFFTREIGEKLHAELQLREDLAHAIELDQLSIVYQPKLDLASSTITGAEALLRWRRPGSGNVSPSVFIPVAEETDLIVSLGNWVLERACRQNAGWRAAGLRPIAVAVNMSTRQFLHEGMVDAVERVLRGTALPASALEIEITESLIASDIERVTGNMRRLKALGVAVAIDDFGTGYSSLSYLKRFSVDRLKIDKSFVHSLPGSAGDAAIARAIISMAHSLRLKVTAEGVETAEQADFLRCEGCDEAQGYLFGRPVKPEALAALLQAVAG
jgi:diguanylate cyclase (GGDEF)-like protein/PAS domain S-box-containing protein